MHGFRSMILLLLVIWPVILRVLIIMDHWIYMILEVFHSNSISLILWSVPFRLVLSWRGSQKAFPSETRIRLIWMTEYWMCSFKKRKLVISPLQTLQQFEFACPDCMKCRFAISAIRQNRCYLWSHHHMYISQYKIGRKWVEESFRLLLDVKWYVDSRLLWRHFLIECGMDRWIVSKID